MKTVFNINDVARLKGAIYTIDNEPLHGVMIHAEGTVDYEQSVMTDINGIFEMDLPKNIGYQINPIKDTDRTNGVSIFDLIMITRHILGLKYLDSPYQHIAADANLSGNITAFDIVLLRKLILDPTDPNLENMKGWRFVEQGTELDVNNPLSLLIQDNSLIDLFTEEKLDIAFTAIKVGDLNSSVSTGGLHFSESRNAKEYLPIQIEDQLVNKGDIISVPVTIPNLKNVLGLQLAFEFDGLELIDTQAGKATTQHYKQLKDNHINVVWDEFSQNQSADYFMEFTFRAIRSGSIKDMIGIDQQNLSPIAYQEEIILVPELKFTESIALESTFALLPNQPNPFKNQTTLQFVLPMEQAIVLEVFDLTGKLVISRKIQGVKGKNTHLLSSDAMRGNKGIYVYQVVAATGILSDKLIVGE